MKNSIFSRLLQPIKDSFVLAYDLRKSFFIALAISLAYVLFNSFVSASYQNRLVDYVLAIGTIALSAQGIKGNSSPAFSDIFINPLTSSYLLKVAILLILFAFSIYFLLCFLLGISTFITINISKNITLINKEELIVYLKSFFRINIPWFILIMLGSIISLYIYFLDTVNARLKDGNMPSHYFGLVVLILFIYFMLISFNLPQKKNFRNAISFGFRNFFGIFSYYLFFLALILILSLCTLFFAKIHFMIAILYEIFVVLGSLVYFQIAFNTLCQDRISK